MHPLTSTRREFLAAVAAASVARTVDAASGPPRLRVMSYNIHHGQGMDGKLDLERIAGVIRNAKPDLVALQEVDVLTTRTGKVDQASRLGELTKMHAGFGKAMAFGGGGYGNAILSTFALANPRTIALPSGPKEEPRCLLLIEISIPVGQTRRTVRFGSTHLNHRNADERLLQAERLMQLTTPGAADATPVILAGDLNAEPKSPEIRLLTAGFVDATAAPVPAEPGAAPLLTAPADKPKTKIDYVLAAPGATWKVVRAEVLAEAVASDHRPVVADLELVL